MKKVLLVFAVVVSLGASCEQPGDDDIRYVPQDECEAEAYDPSTQC